MMWITPMRNPCVGGPTGRPHPDDPPLLRSGPPAPPGRVRSDTHVRIRITGNGQENTAANEIATVDTLKHVFAAGEVDSAGAPIPVAWHGKSLSELLLSREIRPNQLHIVREIKYDEDPSNDTDTAVFAGNQDWYEITHLDDGGVRIARREMEEVDPQISEGTDGATFLVC